MSDTSLPRSQPIKAFKDLLSWKPGNDDYNVAHTPFHPRPPTVSRRRTYRNTNGDSAVDNSSEPSLQNSIDCKIIVCHDMAGGYVEDALPQGNGYSTIYSIQYWNHVDTFIYFSHSRITIPPPVWTNATHRNGVRCLGTIITEWLPGVLETDEMVSGPGQTLANENGDDEVDRRWFSKTYADKLVDMAVYYQFDGWFINIESILRGGAQQANQTIAFLAYLRSQIHARIPGGELIWYDSLSPENYRFFEQSDGIFTNYTWKEKSVGESVALAGPRNRDVYTGIDIWGRNTYGGGGYTTYKALEVIQRERTSCALFAPAWTYESLGKEDFMTNDRLFWSGYGGAGIHAESLPLSSFYDATCRLLAGELGGKPGEAGERDRADNKGFLPVSTYIPARPSGTSSWFYSNFDRGFGKGFWVNGKKVSNKPWSHLSHQSLSPS
ncbi:glycosyl hydrolase family 85-domain-containing protein, partial [Dissophora ornata]